MLRPLPPASSSLPGKARCLSESGLQRAAPRFHCKLEIYIIRFCLIIQLARWTCGECEKEAIDLLSVERAIRLTDYFKNSAISVQNILNENMLTAQQQAIVNHLPATFTTAQAHDVAKENDMKRCV